MLLWLAWVHISGMGTVSGMVLVVVSTMGHSLVSSGLCVLKHAWMGVTWWMMLVVILSVMRLPLVL